MHQQTLLTGTIETGRMIRCQQYQDVLHQGAANDDLSRSDDELLSNEYLNELIEREGHWAGDLP